uniref:Uncharacterized protein n=1 Tax=Panagrolaimus sp. ES5 TaxID=591445 RepID=A0AC34FKH5_9BILA
MKKLVYKIWITNEIYLIKETITTFSSLIYPKLFRWENVNVYVNNEVITFNQFKGCALFLTDISFNKAKITKDDGNVVKLDKILEICTNVKNFECFLSNDVSMINASTIKNLCKLKNFQQIEKFSLNGIPEVFNIEDIATFIK